MWAPPVASRRSPASVAVESESAAKAQAMRSVLVFMASLRHDVALHGGEQPQPLVLFGVLHAGVLERLAQPLHHEVHLGLGVLESLVDLVHRVAGVLASAP